MTACPQIHQQRQSFGEIHEDLKSIVFWLEEKKD